MRRAAHADTRQIHAYLMPTRTAQLFQQVLSAHKTHVPTLSNYAIFLSNVRGDHVGAERLLLRAINADRCNIASLGTYVQLLIGTRSQDHPYRMDRYWV